MKIPSLWGSHDYRPVSLEQDGDDAGASTPKPARRTPVILAFIVSLAAVFSLGWKLGESRAEPELSPYLKLGFTQTDTLHWNTEYSTIDGDESKLHELWDTQIPWEAGIIALDNDEAKAMGLPESQPFPWDGRHKSLYIVNAHHILHCVRNLYISIQQYRSNKTQTIAYPHILHCLDSLRVDTMCSADDTLRYVPLNSAHGFRPGDGQPRKCRDWKQLEKFTDSHDACYRYYKPGDKEVNNLERFKYCPAGSQYLPKIRKYFGFEEDWVPEPQRGMRELEW